MTYEVKRAAVIGAGVMGAAIAAHLANVGVPALLLDVPAEGEGAARDRVARQGLERALKASPALFYDKADARLIETGNVEDDLERLRACDLVVEAIVERLEAKRALFARVAEVRGPHGASAQSGWARASSSARTRLTSSPTAWASTASWSPCGVPLTRATGSTR